MSALLHWSGGCAFKQNAKGEKKRQSAVIMFSKWDVSTRTRPCDQNVCKIEPKRQSRSHNCRRVECLNMCLLRNWWRLSRTRWQLSRLARAMLLSACRCEGTQHATSAKVQTCRRGNHDVPSASSRRSLWSRQTVWCLQDTPRETD